MKKYIVTTGVMLGTTFDNRADAVECGKAQNRRIDEMTGFSKVFGHVNYHYFIHKVTPRIVTTDEYRAAEKNIENIRKELKAEMERAYKIRTAKDHETMMLYHNQQPYNYWDEIEMVIRRNGRRKKIVGVVCGTWVDDNGNVRPELRGVTYPQDAEILSIIVVKRERDVELRWGGVSPARKK